jgi:ABC-2 type transport system ATP-binding protein
VTDPAPVVARGLVKRYGDILAVAGVDLTVEPGDVFGYLGPNGAGKTTSLRMMLGLIRPTGGSVELFGHDPVVDGARALEGVAGFVEGPRFYPYLSGRRNLQLLGDYDEPNSRSRIEEVLEAVELRDRAKDRVGGYSHGMRQRLGIAASLLRQPRLLLLDEPATGLDPAGMRDMRDLVRRLAGDGITILLARPLLATLP